MNNAKRHLTKLVLGLIILFLLLQAQPLAQDFLIRLSGAVIPEGSRTHTNLGSPIRMLSVKGKRWKTWSELEDATAYHAIILLPTASFCNKGYSSSSNRFIRTDTWKWLARKNWQGGYQVEERQLEITYNVVWKTLKVGFRTYFLTDGNLFAIRFDEGGKPIVTQLDASINEPAEIQVMLETFKSLLRGDEEAQKLINERDNLITGECDQ